MHICFLVADFNLQGGGERVVSNLANRFLRQFNYKISIISINQLTTSTTYPLAPEINVDSCGIMQSESATILSKIVCKVKSIWRTKSVVSKIKPDIVLAIGTYPSIVLGIINAKDWISVSCEHLAFVACPKPWRNLRAYFYRRLDAIICLTQVDQLHYKLLNDRVFVIPNSRSFYPGNSTDVENKKLILFVGRLTKQKGVDLMIELFAQINKTKPDWRLKIIGDSNERDEYLALIREFGLDDAIELCASATDMVKEYQSAAFLVMTSRWEGFPMVLLEAQACGLPMISFDCPTGPAEIISDGQDGFLIEAGDMQQMQIKIHQLIENTQLRKQFSTAARQNSDRFRENEILNKWHYLFSSLTTKNQNFSKAR